MAWNPEQYLKFSQPRLQPAVDLLARIETDSPRFVCDLGCGAGNVTRLLAERWPASSILGIDDSPEMLAKAAKEFPDIEWLNRSIDTWQPRRPFDVIYSNAALHWLPDHQTLFASLFEHVAPNGTLAVQMPRNFLAPSHTSIAETVREGPWRAKLDHLLKPSPVAEPAFYYRLLAAQSRTLDIWETEYLHVLEGHDAVKEWVKGTWLKQFLDVLDPNDRSAFEADYAERLRKAYPPLRDGKTLFPFRRLFIVAVKS